jgi:hypothetical protein
MTNSESSSTWLTIPGERSIRSSSSESHIHTPISESSAFSNDHLPKRRPSPLNLFPRVSEPILPVSGDIRFTGSQVGERLDNDDDDDDDEEEEDMERPPLLRPTGGRSDTPLLKEDRGRPRNESPEGSSRPPFVTRRSTFRSRSPDYDAKSATKKKYIYAGFFLLLSLISFVVQTETASLVTQKYGWKKSYCML